MVIFSTYKGQVREIDFVKPYNLAKVIRTTHLNGGHVTSVQCSAIADRYWVDDIRATCAEFKIPCDVIHEEFPS